MCDYVRLCGLMRGFVKCAEETEVLQECSLFSISTTRLQKQNGFFFLMQGIVIPDVAVLGRHRDEIPPGYFAYRQTEKNANQTTITSI